MADIHRRASDVRAKHLLGFQGLVVEDNRNVERPFHNAVDQVTHVVSVTVSGASGSDAIQIVLAGRDDLDDVTFSFTTTAGATTNALAAAEIVDAFNASSAYTAFAWASVDSATVVLTSVGPGAAFAFTATATSSDFSLSSATVTGADPVAAPFGSAITAYPIAPGTLQSLPGLAGSSMLSPVGYGRTSPRVGELIGSLPLGAIATQTSVTLTVTASTNADDVHVLLHINESLLSADVQAVGTTSGTASAIQAAVDALSGVSATVDGDDVIIVVDEIGASVHASFLGTVGTTATVSGVSGQFDQRYLLGIVAYKPTMYDTKTIGEAATGVPAGETGIILEEGFFLAKITGSATDGAHLFAGTSGAERGKLFATGSSTRAAWYRCKKVADARDGFVLCRLLPLAV